MSGNEAFEFVGERGWRRGMGNMLKNEFARWWKTNMWWIQMLIWVGVCGLFLGPMLFGQDAPGVDTTLMVYGLFIGLFPSIAIIIIMQDVLVGEKQEGTAAWVLSKPLSRPGFLLPKLIANGVGVLVTMVLAPGTVGYILISIAQAHPLNPLRFVAALAVIFACDLFFLTFCLMLSTLFNSRGPVIGISIALLFLEQYLVTGVPFLGYFLPWNLFIAIGEKPSSLVYSLLSGTAIKTDHLITLAVVLVESLIFIAISIWRFNKEEF